MQFDLETNKARSIFMADEKPIHLTWIFIELISDLDVIIWEERFDGAVDGQSCFCSIDGVHFKIDKPKPFSRGWFSHKFHSAGVTYEVALNIRTGYIVWIHGGYPAGLYPDLRLSRIAFVPSLRENERAMADKEYKDQNHFILPNETYTELHNLIMARHETVKRRLKEFEILRESLDTIYKSIL